MAISLELPQIGDIQHRKTQNTHTNPTTRSHPPFALPIPQNLIELYRLGNDNTNAATNHTLHTTKQLLLRETTTTYQIDYAAAQVMTVIHEYHDIATKIWPMQPPRQETPVPAKLKPPMSHAELRQIGILAKLRKQCNNTTKLHP